MIKQNKIERENFWNDVISLANGNAYLNSVLKIYVPNKSQNSNYRYADVSYLGTSALLQDRNVSLLLSVGCEPGESRSIPRLQILFKDGEDESRRDSYFYLLEQQFHQYKFNKAHTNDDGLSKIIIRRRKDTTQRFPSNREAIVLVEMIETVVRFLEQIN